MSLTKSLPQGAGEEGQGNSAQSGDERLSHIQGGTLEQRKCRVRRSDTVPDCGYSIDPHCRDLLADYW